MAVSLWSHAAPGLSPEAGGGKTVVVGDLVLEMSHVSSLRVQVDAVLPAAYPGSRFLGLAYRHAGGTSSPALALVASDSLDELLHLGQSVLAEDVYRLSLMLGSSKRLGLPFVVALGGQQ